MAFKQVKPGPTGARQDCQIGLHIGDRRMAVRVAGRNFQKGNLQCHRDASNRPTVSKARNAAANFSRRKTIQPCNKLPGQSGKNAERLRLTAVSIPRDKGTRDRETESAIIAVASRNSFASDIAQTGTAGEVIEFWRLAQWMSFN